MIPLVIDVDSADIMASLLIMKADVEDRIGSRMRMVFTGAAEAHLLAREISKWLHLESGLWLTASRHIASRSNIESSKTVSISLGPETNVSQVGGVDITTLNLFLAFPAPL